MIDTSKYIVARKLKSNNVFEDILLPLDKRMEWKSNKSNTVPIFFYRSIGLKGSKEEYFSELLQLDSKLASMGSRYLKFSSGLKVDNTSAHSNIINTCKELCWSQSSDKIKELTNKISTAGILPNKSNIVNASINKYFMEILELFAKREQTVNETILKNFAIKMLMWIREYIPRLLEGFNQDKIYTVDWINPKILFYGIIKKHEIYFLIFLSKIGCDVLYVNSLCDGEFESIDPHNDYSEAIIYNNRLDIEEFPVNKNVPKEIVAAEKLKDIQNSNGRTERKEMSFEELAKLSDSIVMIKAFDNKGEFLGSGSGIIIDNKGLIATNLHVLTDGNYFEVVFEGMSEGPKYHTSTIINTDFKRDLALICINLNTRPIHISTNDSVRRGQKVVAIGSPLGLMNTVSDGIVSGFRTIGIKDFIQITAPISPGSSGGALLNMYGELIGVTSAGYIDGQNINLAIPSKDLLVLLKDPWTSLSRLIVEGLSRFFHKGKTIRFDCFFQCGSPNNYKVTLYQNKADDEFYRLFYDDDFRSSIENQYIQELKNIVNKSHVTGYDFEIGGQKRIFTYRYDKGLISNKKWIQY